MDITGFERSDKNKSGIISVFDFFCVGKAQTLIPMIQGAIQTLKSICIASCKQYHAPKFVKLDGEKLSLKVQKSLDHQPGDWSRNGMQEETLKKI